LRAELKAEGFVFSSQTDTEVIAHLVEHYQRSGLDLQTASRKALNRMEGAYAVVLLSAREPGVLIGARRGSPLVLGLGEDENYLASDVQALLRLTQRFIFLAEGDLVRLDRNGIQITDRDGQAVQREVKHSSIRADAVERGAYRHFMLKEIHEQAQAVADTLEGRIAHDHVLPGVFGVGAEEQLERVESVHIIACGTSYHAGLVARYWIEALAGIPCTTEIASEYRYRTPVVRPGTLFVTISQSGETADTLAALRLAHERDYVSRLAICNMPESSLVRESDLVLMTRAGPEIGVASTKAFTTQLAALAILTLKLAGDRGLPRSRMAELVNELAGVPGLIAQALQLDERIQRLSQDFVHKQHALFLGRGTHYPVALEGALKLKEISYIHAEAYPAGELKHGPLALVDADMPVIAVAPNNHLLDKLKSNMEEVRARGGKLYVFADEAICHGMGEGQVLPIPEAGTLAAPIIATVPLQLLAYHVAVLRGTDVDQPRNLAKSVTVE
jgi:glucosamine--fructose-6-phosphate aminotransferase (isomerizing)